MQNFLVLFFTFLLGQIFAQVNFFVSADFYLKGSINSEHPLFWESNTFNGDSRFEYKFYNFSMYSPINLGISTDITINNKHEITLGLNTDGNSTKSKVYSDVYSPEFNTYSSSLGLDKGKSFYSRAFLNYGYNLINKQKKTTLKLFSGLGIVWRAGPKFGGENVGTFSFSYYLDENLTVLRNSNIGYTWSKYGWVLNFGIASDLYFKQKYWFSLSLSYSYSPSVLYIEETQITIFNNNTGYYKHWVDSQNLKCNGVYFGISRKFQLYPWIVKKKDKKKKKRNKP